MKDDFSKKLGELLSNVLETGEINSHTEDFSANMKIEPETTTQKKQRPIVHKIKFSADELNKNFSQKRRAGQIIKEGTYKDFTNIPKKVLDAFEILGCTPDSNLADVRAAFRKKIKKSHPDTKAARVSEGTYDAVEKTEKLQDEISGNIIGAYETLKDWFSQKE